MLLIMVVIGEELSQLWGKAFLSENTPCSRKNAHSLRTTILQPYFTQSRGFQQNVQKEIIVFTTKCQFLNTAITVSLCFAAGK